MFSAGCLTQLSITIFNFFITCVDILVRIAYHNSNRSHHASLQCVPRWDILFFLKVRVDMNGNDRYGIKNSIDKNERNAVSQARTSSCNSANSSLTIPLKPPTTFEQQIELFKNRGLIIKDERHALNVLQRINYYRLTSYCLSYKKGDRYCEGITFEDIISLYEFDKKLRHSLLDIIECVEISFRTHIAYHLAHKYGTLGYLDKHNFRNERYHSEFIDELNKEIDRSREIFVKHHKSKYNGQFPVWVAIETISIGCLSKLFHNMKNADKKTISIRYYNISYQYIESWLASLAFVRNICAHHGRLYNRPITKPPKLFPADRIKGIDEYGLFSIIHTLKYIVLDKPKWDYFVLELTAMLESYPIVDIQRLGFPPEWKRLLS